MNRSTETAPQFNIATASALLEIERLLRVARSARELQFTLVNETRGAVIYRQAILLSHGNADKGPYRVEAVSSLPTVERDAPFIRWLERLVASFQKQQPLVGARCLSYDDSPEELKEEWKEFSLPYVLWCPLVHSNETVIGSLWCTRETIWLDQEIAILRRIADTFTHAWQALDHPRRMVGTRLGTRWKAWAVVGAALVALAMPVRMSTVAPARVIPREPAVVSAPLNGVIAEMTVPANAMVQEGQPLFRYEDTTLRSSHEVAEKNLAVALADYHRAAQGSFQETKNKADVPLLKAEVELKETERNFAREQLDQTLVKAPRAGLLLYSDKSDWIGKPVVVGERIMEVADPAQVELRVNLPVSDAIVLREGAPVTVFLDAQPLEPLAATVTHASYHAEVLPGNLLAYRITATFTDPTQAPRIGWQGTAKVYGESTSVFFLLFRRPISAARQFTGL
ncbi:MAG: uncharacterized protein HW416_1993 [Chloroflexi bacterium]|nr:uncharacterized protein [Chloroflexota bacterium]